MSSLPRPFADLYRHAPRLCLGDKTAIKQFINMWLDSVGYGESDVTMRSLTEEDRAILRRAFGEGYDGHAG